jgi:hypothetical protein
MPVHAGVLKEVAVCSAFLELFLGEEKIILAVHLAAARRARGARNGVNEIRLLAERADERRLPRARRGGEDE